MGYRTIEEIYRRKRAVLITEDKYKLGQTMLKAAWEKRRKAQALWDEAEEDSVKGHMLIEEAEREQKARETGAE